MKWNPNPVTWAVGFVALEGDLELVRFKMSDQLLVCRVSYLLAPARCGVVQSDGTA